MIEAGVLLGEEEWVSAGMKAWDYSAQHLWSPDAGLVRHLEGNEVYLFEDQVSFLKSLIAVLELTNDPHLLAMADTIVKSVEKNFSSPEGGYVDVLKSDDAVGELGSPRRSLMANAEWAEAIELGSTMLRHREQRRPRVPLRPFSRMIAEYPMPSL